MIMDVVRISARLVVVMAMGVAQSTMAMPVGMVFLQQHNNPQQHQG